MKGAGENGYVLQYVLKNADVEVGDHIVTAGIGGAVSGRDPHWQGVEDSEETARNVSGNRGRTRILIFKNWSMSLLIRRIAKRYSSP